MDRAKCTIEEREEYEPYVERGAVIFAGVDYEAILRKAEEEADIIIWDGGNNDLPFFKSDYHIVVVDPHRPGHELRYHPGEANLRMADVVVINKIDNRCLYECLTVYRNDGPRDGFLFLCAEANDHHFFQRFGVDSQRHLNGSLIAHGDFLRLVASRVTMRKGNRP